MKGKLNLHIQIVVHSRCSALSANLHYRDTRVKRQRNEEATGDISGQGFQELRGTKLMQSVGPHSLSADSLAPRMELRPIRASQHILKGSLKARFGAKCFEYITSSTTVILLEER